MESASDPVKQRQLWEFAEKLVPAGGGKGGFCCFSCHYMVLKGSIGLIRNHLKRGCKAVLPCTLDRLATIPEDYNLI